jgi:uncharacterized protein (TIGR02145 family)
MKQSLNLANHFAMLLMALAIAFTFLACEKKEKKAEAEATPAETEQAVPEETGQAEAGKDCPEGNIGSPKTAEATFLTSTCSEGCFAKFRLDNGEEITLFCGDPDLVENVKEGIKVSITYQKKQRWVHDEFQPAESGCYEEDNLQSLTVLSKDTEGSPLTYEGQTYKIVIIGKQTWMAENLNYNAKGSKCYQENDSNCKKYGRLYDWETAKKVCPSGWHLPSEKEWDVLPEYKHLKAKEGWKKNSNGTDDFGFSAFPGGYGNSDGSFSSASDFGSWWSSSEYGNGRVYVSGMGYDGYDDEVFWNSYGKDFLLSVRCVKD